MFDIQFFEEQTQCLNPKPIPVKEVPDELLRNVMQDGYLREDGGSRKGDLI
jgi:hypothetical protein